MSALMEMFTATPQLSAADRRKARFEGRQFAKAACPPPRRGPTAAQIAFAHRSLQHMGVSIVMGSSTRVELLKLHHGMRTGTDAHLEHYLSSIAQELRSLSWNERREAWHLFGQGLVL